MSVCGTTVSGIVLLDTGLIYFLCAHYNVTPINLQSHYIGVGTAFEVCHALICISGGLVIKHHNKVHDELLYLVQQAFTS